LVGSFHPAVELIDANQRQPGANPDDFDRDGAGATCRFKRGRAQAGAGGAVAKSPESGPVAGGVVVGHIRLLASFVKMAVFLSYPRPGACWRISGGYGFGASVRGKGAIATDGDLDLADAAVRDAFLFGDLPSCETGAHAAIDCADAPLGIHGRIHKRERFAAIAGDQTQEGELPQDALEEVPGVIAAGHIEGRLLAIEERQQRPGGIRPDGGGQVGE